MKKLQRGAKKLDIDVAGEKSIDPIGELTKLEKLVLRGYKMNLAPLAKLTQLRELTLDISRDVKGLEHLAELTSLRVLRIHEPSLKTLDIVKNMTELRELEILGGLQTAKGIEGAKRLEKVALNRTMITSLAPLAALKNLRELALRFSRKLVDLRGIEAIKSLRDLDLFEVLVGLIRSRGQVAYAAI